MPTTHAWILGRNEHKGGWIGDAAGSTGKGDGAIFDWLAENIEFAAKFWQFIQKQHAAMRQGYHSGPNATSTATNQASE
jgi:hypothetical protein